MSSPFITAVASLLLFGAGLASAEGTRSAAALPAEQPIAPAEPNLSTGKCRIEVVRSGTPGTASISRLQEADGGCLCTVTTGPVEGNGQAEGVIEALLRDRSCDGAPAPNQSPTAFAPGPSLLPLLAAPVGAAGAAAAASVDGGGNDSAG